MEQEWWLWLGRAKSMTRVTERAEIKLLSPQLRTASVRWVRDGGCHRRASYAVLGAFAVNLAGIAVSSALAIKSANWCLRRGQRLEMCAANMLG
jgi:hypothetical protein